MLLTIFANFWESSFRKHPAFQITTSVSLVIIIATWVALYVIISPLSYLTQTGTIPLHYNLYFGIDAFGPWYSVFAIPALATLTLVVNTLLAYLLFVQERVVSYFLLISHVVVTFITGAAALFTILLNT